MLNLSENQHKKLIQIGGILQRKREEMGYSIKRIADITRISWINLKSIEEGKYQEFSSPVFIRGFIRSYAEFLGLDNEWTQSELSKVFLEETEKEVKINDVLIQSKKKSPASIQIKPLVVSLSSLLAIFLAATLIYVYLDDIKFFSGESVYSFSLPEDKPAREKPPSKAELPPQGLSEPKNFTMDLVLKSTEDTWARIKLDGSEAFDYRFAPDEKKNWKALENIDVTLSKGSAFSVIMDREVIPIPENKANSLVKLNFTPKAKINPADTSQ